MKIGITCYPTFGGSGVVATELGIALAERGDEVHFISYALPSRLDLPRERVHFHEVVAPSYPLFVSPPYTLALATKMAEVAGTPHARPAPRPLRAAPRDLGDPGARDGQRQRRAAQGRDDAARHRHHDRRPGPLVPADHALGDRAERRGDRGLRATCGRSRSASSASKRPIDVVPNFVDTRAVPARRRVRRSPARLAREGEALIVHVSNFRPVKRIPDVLAIFDAIRQQAPGAPAPDRRRPGPRSLAERLAREGGFEDRTTFLGNVPAIETILPAARLHAPALRRRVLRARGARGDGLRRPGHRHRRRRAARGRRGRDAAAILRPVGDVDGDGRGGARAADATTRCGAASRQRRAAAPSGSFRPRPWSSDTARSTKRPSRG